METYRESPLWRRHGRDDGDLISDYDTCDSLLTIWSCDCWSRCPDTLLQWQDLFPPMYSIRRGIGSYYLVILSNFDRIQFKELITPLGYGITTSTYIVQQALSFVKFFVASKMSKPFKWGAPVDIPMPPLGNSDCSDPHRPRGDHVCIYYI